MGAAGQAVDQQQHLLATGAEIFGDRGSARGGAQAQHRGMIGRHGDHDALVHRVFELGFEEVADFAAALANQANDDDIGFGPGDHLAHQHGFTDPRACDDGDTLTAPGSKQRVDGADAEIERFGDAAAIEDIALDAIQGPDAARDDRPLAV